VARNPIAELAQIASEIFDARTGRAKIPRFYDDVEKLTKSWTENFRKAGFTIDRSRGRTPSSRSGRRIPSTTRAWAGRPPPRDRPGSSACDALCSRAYNAQEQGV
jgi:hypothetical protein